ncbi:MAG: NosD domain-containing protein [Planctomycetota bacterium]
MRILPILLALAGTSLALDREIDADTKIPKGTHALSEPLKITADGVTLDLGEAELRGADFKGIGIVIDGRKNVTIRGGKLRGFRCAILVRDCEKVTIEGVDVSGNFRQKLRSTPEREDATDWLRPHDNDKQEWRKRYGAGICLENCADCRIVECVGRNQQNGLLLDRCTGVRALDNDFSFNSGWGIALWRSSENLISQNKCDWCVRGYSHGVYDRGQDSAGILLFEQCSRNTIFRNSATHSGDGFFLYAGEQTLKKTGEGGCNDNLVAYNDFSHAVANAIEATFSRGNRFLGNRCDDSNYGVWAGYSYGTLIEGNTFTNNRHAGVAIEHGRENRIVFNTFNGNRDAIRLWWDDDKDLLATKFGKKHDCKSEVYLIAANSFEGDKTGIRLRDTSNVAILGNHFEEVETKLVKDGKCDGVSEGEDAPKDLHGTKIDEELPAHRDVFLPANHPRGMRFIHVDDKGPLDPTQPNVYPRRVVAWDRCRFQVMGAREKMKVEVDGAVLVVIDDAGIEFTVQEDGLHSFAGKVILGDRTFPIEGVLLKATWTVQHWAWTADPRKDWSIPAKTVERKTGSLDFVWGSGAPAKGMKPDRFATRATTKLKLPKGRYVVRTLSDDGVRVKIDGKVVLEDWTWHAPKEQKAEIDLAAGEHDIVVEHFEIDGYAVLQFDLRPAR